MERSKIQYRTINIDPQSFTTRDDSEAPKIEGFFSVYNSVYQIASDMSESIAPGAFTDSITGDVRALINHNTDLVLGRTAAHTLELRDDTHGLWGSILINPNDTDAMNAYERVKRGDVSQCSIGFEIMEEETEIRDDDSIHWTIKRAKLWEVSICTFPAYEETSVSARSAQRDEIRKRQNEAWRAKMKERLNNGFKSTDVA